MIDFNEKKWTISTLKTYLRKNGHEKLSGKNKPELRRMAFNTEKGKALQEEENSSCGECKKIIDDCECERCHKCFETPRNCLCIQKQERKQKIDKMKNVMKPLRNIFQQFTEQQKEVATPQVIEKPKKKVIKKIVKKTKKIVTIEEPEMDIFDVETELQIKALKIKIKLFISDKIENKKSVQQDVFDLLDLILTKHKITLKEEEKEIFPKIFKRIFKESKYKQKTILKDIVIYLVECDTKSFDSLL